MVVAGVRKSCKLRLCQLLYELMNCGSVCLACRINGQQRKGYEQRRNHVRGQLLVQNVLEFRDHFLKITRRRHYRR